MSIEPQNEVAGDPLPIAEHGKLYRTTRSIELDAEPSEVFSRFTRFERLHEAFDSVRRVKMIGPGRALWDVDLAGVQLVWEARITGWEPDSRLAWKSCWGPRHQGEVRVEKVNEQRTRLSVAIEYRASGLIQRIGAWFDLIGKQLETELMLFERYLNRQPVPDRAESRTPSAA